jgi:hypothetical protein
MGCEGKAGAGRRGFVAWWESSRYGFARDTAACREDKSENYEFAKHVGST